VKLGKEKANTLIFNMEGLDERAGEHRHEGSPKAREVEKVSCEGLEGMEAFMEGGNEGISR
jgi:hypothetical protein